MTTVDQNVINAVLRTDFPSFVRRCFQTLNPGAQYHDNWHIEAICYQLERVRKREITRLIINLPPRYLKSVMVSVAFPAFLLGHDPSHRIFGVSYGADLALKHAADFRAIVESPWYHRAVPRMQISRSLDTEVHTTWRGYRRATSVNAALTGFGGDCFIIDDPQKPVDAQSEALRNSLNQWFSNTLLSRLDSKERGSIVVVMQRVHMNDFTGYLLENAGDWTLLSLPAIAEENAQIPLGSDKVHVRYAGEVLHPEYESLAALKALQRQLGSDVFSAQYQQAPVPAGGAMIKREWLKYYDKAPERTYRTKVIQSWDTAAKAGAQNDWSVCTTWLLSDKHYYLLDLTRGRYEYPRLRDTAVALAERFKPNVVLIEDASTGQALAPELKKALSSHVKPIPVTHDKQGRLYVQQDKFEAGRVLFPKGASFLPELEAELLTFPQGKTDDQVDSISQALAYQVGGYDRTLSWVS